MVHEIHVTASNKKHCKIEGLLINLCGFLKQVILNSMFKRAVLVVVFTLRQYNFFYVLLYDLNNKNVVLSQILALTM